MIFANPLLAIATLLAAAIPILLHVFLRRPKSTPWGSNFLLQIALQKIHRRRKLEKWLLLLLRVLAIALVGFAMAGPFTKSWMREKILKERWIVIDDGATSAELKSNGKSVLDELKQEVIQSIQKDGASNRYAVVLASVPARVLFEPTSNKEFAIESIQKVFSREVPCDISDALDKALEKSETNAPPRDVEIWSGFRQGSIRLEQPLSAALIQRAQQSTLTISKPQSGLPQNQTLWKCSIIRSAIETEEANQSLVKMEIRREGALEQAANQILFQNNQNVMVAKKDFYWNEIATETEFDVRLQLERGTQQGIQATIQEDAQPFDNKIFLSCDLTDKINVTVLGRKSTEQNIENLPASNWIIRAIESTGMTVQEIDAETISIRQPSASDTVILTRPDLVDQAGWTWLLTFAKNGGVLIVTPASESAEQNWAVDIERLLEIPIRSQKEIKVADIRLATKQPRIGPLSILGAELDLLSEPIHVAKHIHLETTDAAGQASLLFEDGSPMMCWAKPKNGSGLVVILAVSPELSWSDLPVKPLMVPLFQELVRGGRAIATEQQEIQTGSTLSLGSSAAGGMFIPPAQSGAPTIEIDENGQSQTRVLTPGLWTLQKRNGQTQTYAVNISPAAASIQPLTENALRVWFGSINTLQFQDEKKPINASQNQGLEDPAVSGALFILALVFALVESVLSRKGSPQGTRPVVGVST